MTSQESMRPFSRDRQPRPSSMFETLSYGGVVVFDPSGSSSLYHFNFIDIVLGIRIPY